jgi:hypothetical protein
MRYYSNIFASSFKFYSGFRRETPRFSAICIVVVCQFTMLFLILTLIKNYTTINPFLIFPSKYYGIPLTVLWISFAFIYFRKDRVETIMKNFEEKSLLERRFWAIVTIISLIFPTVFMAYLLSK